MAYGTRFYYDFSAWDGEGYRVEFQRRGYDGVGHELTPAADPVIYRLGKQSRSIPFLNASELECRVQSVNRSDLREVLDPDPKAWRVRLKRSGSVIWRGFVPSERFTSDPFETNNVVTVTAKDGLGLLRGNPYEYAINNDGQRSFLDQIIDQVGQIGFRGTLHTLMNWYPYREEAQLTGEPLSQLSIDLRTWKEPKSDRLTADRHDVLKEIAVGYGLEFFQGWDGWYAVQPVELLDESADIYPYSEDGTLQATETPQHRNADAWHLIRAGRGGQTRHSSVAATYDFEPDPENLIQHPGFEPDDPNASTPTWDDVKGYWDFRSSPRLDDGSWTESELDEADVSIQRRSFLMEGSTESDSYALAGRFRDSSDLGSPVIAEASTDFVGAGYPMVFRLAFDCWIDPNVTEAEVSTPAVQVDINGGEYRLGEVQALPQQEVPPGQERRIPTSFQAGSNPWPSEWPEGQAVIPKGAKIPMQSDFGNSTYDDIAQTTRAFRVGENDIYCSFADTVTLDPVPALQLPIFFPTDPSTSDDSAKDYDVLIASGVTTQVVMETYLPRTQVNDITIKLKSRRTTNTVDVGQFGLAYDNIEISFLLDGEVIREFTWTAATGKEGRKMDHPPVRFGDGPQSVSRGAVTFENGDTTLVDDKIGWKRAPWASDVTPNGRTLAQMRAIERLRTRTSGTEEQELDFLLRDGDLWSPDSVLEFTTADNDKVSLWRRSVEWHPQSGRLRLPSYALYQNSDGAIYTTLSSTQ